MIMSAPLERFGTEANDLLAERIVTRLPCSGFLDIGAHIGSIMGEVARHCPTITAIEAMPDKANRLRRKFPSAEIHCCALSDHEGEATFYVNVRQSGYSSLAPGAGTREIRVPLRTLDSLFPDASWDLVKIDVEGAEEGVVRGGVKLIDRCRPVILFESGPAEALGYTKAGMWSFFNELGYGLFVPNRLAHTAPLCLSTAFWTAIFTQDERPITLLRRWSISTRYESGRGERYFEAAVTTGACDCISSTCRIEKSRRVNVLPVNQTTGGDPRCCNGSIARSRKPTTAPR